jgi:hypothetical protein
MRLVVLLSSLLFAACTVGEVGTSNNVTDGGMSGGNVGSNAPGCVARIVPPGDKHTHLAGGTSNAGLNCIVAGCHQNNALGTNAPGYQFAGTIYKVGSNPLQPNAGATVQIKSGATVLTTVTDSDGNFSFAAGSLAGTFSANTVVTACPGLTPMVGPLVSGGGPGANACNLCHTTGAGAMAPPITL